MQNASTYPDDAATRWAQLRAMFVADAQHSASRAARVWHELTPGQRKALLHLARCYLPAQEPADWLLPWGELPQGTRSRVWDAMHEARAIAGAIAEALESHDRARAGAPFPAADVESLA